MRIENRLFRRITLAVCLGFFALALPLSMVSADEAVETKYQFFCENDGFGLSVFDVLRASGDHDVFLELFSKYDPEGFAILADPELADKTVWAPTNAAFLAISDSLSSLSEAEIRAILGYHISPPRRAPFSGTYPILTPQYLLDAGNITHRTRTGVLTGSDQRTKSIVDRGVIAIEGANIISTAWCTETGSVFSIDAVITDVQKPSAATKMIHRIVHILLYDDIRFVIYSTFMAVLISLIVMRVFKKFNQRKKE